MKQTVLALALATLPLTATAQVWAPQSSSGGGSGGGSSCYLVTFNAGHFGTRSLIGSGAVSGSFFTGFMWWPGLQRGARSDCGRGAVGQCAWHSVYNGIAVGGFSRVNASVAVSALPIISAQPTGCY